MSGTIESQLRYHAKHPDTPPPLRGLMLRAVEELRYRAMVIEQRNAEIKRGHDDFVQAITDPENQPSQWGTVTLALAQQGAQQPVAWYEYNQDLDAWFLAYGHNPKAKTRPLVFGDTAAPAPQAHERSTCNHCDGTGWVVRDPDIGTDQECFVCDGSGYVKEEPAPQPAQELTGCACRWDADDNRVATCVRHQGWLDVVGEWADRAKAAEAALQSAQPVAQPLTDDQIMAIGREMGLKCKLGGNPNIDFDYARAIEAAIREVK